MRSIHCLLAVLVVLARSAMATADDWPMWRHDAARSAAGSEALPAELHLVWSRQLPQLKPAYREKRLQFDAGYEPVVLGGRLFVGSSARDSVTAYDANTGEELWRYYTNGPVRFAPVAWQDRVFAGSDDGYLYCLAAADGKLLWKFLAVPSHRKVLGNGRLISLWPVRGGPVLHQGKLYFAAGVWSFEGTFIYALDAKTGETVWLNDSSGFVFGQHPHAAEAIGGVTPQGYLVVAGDELVVPCGQALPARYDLKTGKLTSFELPKPGRMPGGWFVSSAAARRGEVEFDGAINSDKHEDKVYQGPGSPDVRDTIHLGGKPLKMSAGLPRIDGTLFSVLSAGGKVYAATADGWLHCLAAQKPAQVRRYELPARKTVNPTPLDDLPQLAALLRETRSRHGYAVVFGAPDDRLLRGLLEHTQFRVIAIEPDAPQVDKLRRQFDAFGEYGNRLSIVAAAPEDVQLPPYLAHAMLVDSRGSKAARPAIDAALLEALRPYGGTACLPLSESEHKQLQALAGPQIARAGELTVVHRNGPLPGSVNYTGGWSSPDQRVRAPLGVLWFDDELGHFKRSPQPMFVDGVMISYRKDWSDKTKIPYPLLPAVYSDVYTGRVISEKEPWLADLKLPEFDRAAPQPNQYRPPNQKNAWKPEPPVIGERVNPLTGKSEPRAFPKSYGCDGGVNYGYLYTMRSGTPAFYDTRLESGTCSISGPRSGCTNSIIPACGLLNVPYFYEGCTCSYPLPVALALVPLPETHEQWFYWGPDKPRQIQRVGINFGAPGDRMTRAGTLWLDYPNRGGPSPEVDVKVEPATAEFYYRHSTSIDGGTGWPWVGASGVIGAEKITIRGIKPGKYTVRLTHARPDRRDTHRAVEVSVNGTALRGEFNSSRRFVVFNTMKGVECDGTFTVRLKSIEGKTFLNGLEIIADGLPLGEDPDLPVVDRRQLYQAE